MTEYDASMTREDDQIRDLLEKNAPDAYYRRRAQVINLARAHGWTWEEIAAPLGMQPVGVQRAPYVSSPWNLKRHPEQFGEVADE